MAFYWYGEQAMGMVKGKAADRIERAARTFRDRLRQDLSAAFPPTGEPGGYPAKRTGHLRRNVQMEMDRNRMVARVGTNVVYGKYLEFGTSKMAARPWMTNGLRDHHAEIRQIMGGGLGGGLPA